MTFSKLKRMCRALGLRYRREGEELLVYYHWKHDGVWETAKLFCAPSGSGSYHPRGQRVPYAVGCLVFDRRANSSIRFTPESPDDWGRVLFHFKGLPDVSESIERANRGLGLPEFNTF